MSSFSGGHPCFFLYSLCFLRASSSNEPSSSSEEDDEDDFVLTLDFWNGDLDFGCSNFEGDDLNLDSSWGMELNLLSNPEPKPSEFESSVISL